MAKRLLRSMLYVPADNHRRVGKAFETGADAVILDLEDAVAVSQKPAARAGLVALLAEKRPCAAYVRVNSMSTPFCLQDIETAVLARADGISLPKVESAAQIFAADWIMAQLEKRMGLEVGSIDLLPSLETGKGIHDAREVLAGARRVRHAGLGVGDLMLELNLSPGPDDAEVWPYRTMLVLASNAAGLEAPLDTVWLDLKNLDGLRAACEASKRAGFQGRRLIHPSHVAIANEVYAPTEQEIARAERIVKEFAEAAQAGLATMRVGEDFVDYPIAQKAQRILAARDAILAHRTRAATPDS